METEKITWYLHWVDFWQDCPSFLWLPQTSKFLMRSAKLITDNQLEGFFTDYTTPKFSLFRHFLFNKNFKMIKECNNNDVWPTMLLFLVQSRITLKFWKTENWKLGYMNSVQDNEVLTRIIIIIYNNDTSYLKLMKQYLTWPISMTSVSHIWIWSRKSSFLCFAYCRFK